MYTRWAPRGESYTMIVLRVRGHRSHVCQVLRHQSLSHCCPSSPRLAIKNSGETLQGQQWCLGFTTGNVCLQAVRTRFAIPNSDKIWHPVACDMQPTATQKERYNAVPFPSMSRSSLTLESGGTRAREQSAPIYSRPHPLWLSLSEDDAGIHGQAQRQTSRRICHRGFERCCCFSPVCFIQAGLLKARTRHKRVHRGSKTLITRSAAADTAAAF